MADILTPPTSGGGVTYTDGAAVVMVPKIINATWNLGLDKSAEYDALIADARSTYLSMTNVPEITAGSASLPTIVDPGVTIPSTMSVDGMFDKWKTEYLALMAELVNQFTAFRTAYFPAEQALYNSTEQWLKDALANPNAALPPAVVAQLLGDAQAQVLADKVRSQDAVVAQFAARRFPLPPDAAASAVLQIEQKSQDELAAAGRAITGKAIENLQFVVKTAVEVRDIALKDAVEYIKALASGPNVTSQMMNYGYDLQTKLISAAAQYLNARTAAAEAVGKMSQYNNTTQLEVGKANQTAYVAFTDLNTKAMMSDAARLAQLATSLFNNMHTGGTISNSAQNSVSYNYSNDTNSQPASVTGVGG